MNILGVTLARGGSKGVPNKHTRELCGKPMIAWTLEEAKKSKYLNNYVLSSDDNKILEIGKSYPSIGLWKRPDYLALDSTPTLPALQNAIEGWEVITKKTCDYIIEIRATSPLKTVEDIDAMIALLIESQADSVIGVTQLEDHHPARIKRLVNGYIKDFSVKEPISGRRQDLKPKAYVRNGTVYALTREAVMGKNAKLFGHEKSLAYIMPAERSVNIDTEMDWLLCEAILESRRK